jgi:hypothetical protein
MQEDRKRGTRMTTTAITGQDFIDEIRSNGIPEPWQEFGWRLARDGALSNALVDRVTRYRTRRSSPNRLAVLQLFAEKLENLRLARDLLHGVMREYDETDQWSCYTVVLATTDLRDLEATLQSEFGLHRYPVVCESVRFNMAYIGEHGARAFYAMTDEYLAKIETLTSDGLRHFEDETRTEESDPYWLFRLDLNSIEVGLHCDVCRMSSLLRVLALKKGVVSPREESTNAARDHAPSAT